MIEKILDKNNVPYEKIDFGTHILINVYQFPIKDLSDKAKFYAIQCSIIKFKNQKEYEVGYDYNVITKNFKIKKYKEAKKIYEEIIKNCYITDNEIVDIKNLGKIQHIY